jgi:hypothetical protein
MMAIGQGKGLTTEQWAKQQAAEEAEERRVAREHAVAKVGGRLAKFSVEQLRKRFGAAVPPPAMAAGELGAGGAAIKDGKGRYKDMLKDED